MKTRFLSLIATIISCISLLLLKCDANGLESIESTANNRARKRSDQKLSLSVTSGTSNGVNSCPRFCSCLHENKSREISLHVDCSNKDYLKNPLELPPLTTHLVLSRNRLKAIPDIVKGLKSLQELFVSNNEIKVIEDKFFENNERLNALVLKSNSLENIGQNALTNLKTLKTLILSESRRLTQFPNQSGNVALERLRIDRGSITLIPSHLCDWTPLLKELNLKSNRIQALPLLNNCKELRILDLSYNRISSFEEIESFANQANLVDLILSHNRIRIITDHAFRGLRNLRVLDLQDNKINEIKDQAFTPLRELIDLNLGNNEFKTLPVDGLQSLRHLKVFGNAQLKQFPSPDSLPKIHSLALSYAYHCCAYLDSKHSHPNVDDDIIWFDKFDGDMPVWNNSGADIWPGDSNFSSKFNEYTKHLWQSFHNQNAIPENLAQYAEEYFDANRPYNLYDDSSIKYPVRCIPKPTPFMPCDDLFDWWSLRCGVWLVFLLALLGNGIVIVVLLFGRSKLDVPRFLVCNLAVADLFMGIYLGMLAVVDATTLGEFKIYAISWQTSKGCQIAGFLGVLSSELSVYTLAVITMERNYAITHAMHLNKRLSLKHSTYVMSFGWAFALTMSVLPFFGISDYRKFAICLPFETSDVYSKSFVISLIVINGFAFSILMFCYLRMYCAIRGSQAWNSNDSRIAKRMAILVFTDFLCWAPIAFFTLTAVAGYELISLSGAKVFTVFILPLNSCANPFLYAIFTKQFKRDCVMLCKRIEESRVTRGIGRGRNSSNFSNRHTPANSNSAVDKRSNSDPTTFVCQCGILVPKNAAETQHLSSSKSSYIKQFASRFFSSKTNKENVIELTDVRNMRFNRKQIDSTSSENFSWRSDSCK